MPDFDKMRDIIKEYFKSLRESYIMRGARAEGWALDSSPASFANLGKAINIMFSELKGINGNLEQVMLNQIDQDERIYNMQNTLINLLPELKGTKEIQQKVSKLEAELEKRKKGLDWVDKLQSHTPKMENESDE